jgi:hypothetical protein
MRIIVGEANPVALLEQEIAGSAEVGIYLSFFVQCMTSSLS